MGGAMVFHRWGEFFVYAARILGAVLYRQLWQIPDAKMVRPEEVTARGESNTVLPGFDSIPPTLMLI